MNPFGRFLGIVGSFFQVGGPSGPAWKNNSGNLDARNSADSAYVNVRGLDPVGAQDFVTLTYGQSNFGGSVVPNTISGTTLNVTTGKTLPFGGSLRVTGTGSIHVTGTGALRGT